MLSNSIIASVVLGCVAIAAPTNPESAFTSSAGATSTTSTPAAAPTAPSLTSQLFLADLAADRFGLIPHDQDFKFDFNNAALRGKAGKGGDIIAANRKTFPALVGTGSGMAVGFLGPCGFNTPHVHPRATELQIVTQGKLHVEMVPENGVFNIPGDSQSGRRVIKNTVGKLEMTPFYQGSIHTQFNPDCTDAIFVASFTSEDFGAGQALDETIQFSPEIVTAAFGEAIDGADVDAFKKAIPVAIATGVESCLKKCNIKKR
ncbi:cupin [Diplocarpon rosae]|nr:cupin [Diplocarpon rosae]